MRPLPALVGVVLALAAAAPAAGAAVIAPGRAAYPLVGGRPEIGLDDASVTGAALPDGGALLAGPLRAGLLAVRIDARGALVRTFGSAGVARLASPVNDGSSADVVGVLPRADGRFVMVTTGAAVGTTGATRLLLVGLTADGRLDPAFGQDGRVDTGLGIACGPCAPAALAPDGSIVVTGDAIADAAPAPAAPAHGPPPPQTRAQWTAERLTAAGTLDPAFGDDGRVALPVAPSTPLMGETVAVLGDGRIVALGHAGTLPVLVRLLPSGAMDPAFNAGAPVSVPLVSGVQMLAHADGVVDVLAGGAVMRYDASGAADPAFGAHGVAVGGASMLAAADGGLVVYGYPSRWPVPIGRPSFIVSTVSALGAVHSTGLVLPFGGGQAGRCCAVRRIATQPSLAQNGLDDGQLAERPDGSFLALGRVAVVERDGRDTAFSAPFAAVAALTADLRPDPSFGRAATAPRVAVHLAAQRTSTVRAQRYVTLRLTSSVAGLARIRVRDARGRTLFAGVRPVWAAGSRSADVPLAAAGVSALAGGRRTRVRISVTLRDVLGAQATARATGALR